VWTCLLGASSGTHKKLHFSVSFFTSYLKEPVRKKLELIINIAIIAIMLLVIFIGVESLKVARIQTFPGLGISKIWMNIPIVIFASLTTIFMMKHIQEKFITRSK
jgi:TRAP-type C4-dicarboxylate transport system permease small subunit